MLFRSNDTATTEIYTTYDTLSLHDALPFSPVLLSVLLLRVSGVVLLERDIGERRPDYRRYVLRTNAFFPGPSREA